MKVAYTCTKEIELKQGTELPVDRKFIEDNFPLIESTCNFDKWVDFFGSKNQNGMNTVPVKSIRVLFAPTSRVSSERVALMVTWNNCSEDQAVVITGISE